MPGSGVVCRRCTKARSAASPRTVSGGMKNTPSVSTSYTPRKLLQACVHQCASPLVTLDSRRSFVSYLNNSVSGDCRTVLGKAVRHDGGTARHDTGHTRVPACTC